MKIRMVEQREGELLGPVDWSYDFEKHSWERGPGGGCNPDCIKRGKEALKIIEDGMKEGKQFTVGAYGANQKVLAIGMYDGWPFWTPTPAVLLETWMGGEWQFYYSLSNPKEIEDRAVLQQATIQSAAPAQAQSAQIAG